MAEQRYQAVLAVISDGLSISQVAEKFGVSRQTLHAWLARYEAQGLVDRSHRPVSCPHQMPAAVEAAVFLHGLAGDFACLAQDEHTVLATDTVAHLWEAFKARVVDEGGLTWICGLAAKERV